MGQFERVGVTLARMARATSTGYVAELVDRISERAKERAREAVRRYVLHSAIQAGEARIGQPFDPRASRLIDQALSELELGT